MSGYFSLTEFFLLGLKFRAQMMKPRPLDSMLLHKIGEKVDEIEAAYENFENVSEIIGKIADFNNYLNENVIKVVHDRLSFGNDFNRRSAKILLYILLGQFRQIISPILPILAEEIWQAGMYRRIFGSQPISRPYLPCDGCLCKYLYTLIYLELIHTPSHVKSRG